jgi:hypothetical protein
LGQALSSILRRIPQRLHQDDLVGHVLEQEDWDVLCLRQNDDLSVWARLAAKTRREKLGF